MLRRWTITSIVLITLSFVSCDANDADSQSAPSFCGAANLSFCTLRHCNFPSSTAIIDKSRCPSSTPFCCVPSSAAVEAERAHSIPALCSSLPPSSALFAYHAWNDILDAPDTYFVADHCCRRVKMIGAISGVPVLFLVVKLFFIAPMLSIVFYLAQIVVKIPVLRLLLARSTALREEYLALLLNSLRLADAVSCLRVLDTTAAFGISLPVEKYADIFGTHEVLLQRNFLTPPYCDTELSKRLSKDKDTFLPLCLRRNERAFRCAAQELRSDPDFVLSLIGAAEPHASTSLRAGPLEVESGSRNPFSSNPTGPQSSPSGGLSLSVLQFASESLLSDKHFALRVVKQHWGALRYFHETIRSDYGVVWCAVQHHWESLRFASAALRGHRSIVHCAVSQNGGGLEFASEALCRDKDLVLTAVKKSWFAIEFAHSSLRKDKDVVTAAVQQNGSALCHVLPPLIHSRDIVLQAVTVSGVALGAVVEPLRQDRNIVRTAIRQDGLALQFASEKFQSDESLVLEAVAQNPDALRFASPKVRDNSDVVLQAVRLRGSALQYASTRLQSDPVVVEEALAQDPEAIAFSHAVGIRSTTALEQSRRRGESKRKLRDAVQLTMALSMVLDNSAAFTPTNSPSKQHSPAESPDHIVNIKYDARLSRSEADNGGDATEAPSSLAHKLGHWLLFTGDESSNGPAARVTAILPWALYMKQSVWGISLVERIVLMAQGILGAAVSIACFAETLASVGGSVGHSSLIFAATLVNGPFLSSLVQWAVAEYIASEVTFLDEDHRPIHFCRMPIWYQLSVLLLCSILFIPLVLFFWMPTLAMYFPWVAVLFLLLAIAGSELFRLLAEWHEKHHVFSERFGIKSAEDFIEERAGADSGVSPDARSPASVIAVVSVSFALRGLLTFGILLLLQMPLNWGIMTYYQPEYIMQAANYFHVVGDEWLSRGMTCALFNSYASQVNGLALTLNII